MSETHTPTPWIQSGVRQKLGSEDCIMIGPDGFMIAALPIGRNPKEHAGAFCDAKFIVEAVNSHAALAARVAELEADKELLREALTMARAYMNVSLGSPTWKGENPYPVIDAALNGAASPALPDWARREITALKDEIAAKDELVARLEGAGNRLLAAAKLMYANGVGCVTNHYPADYQQMGLPGWLSDCERDILAFAAIGNVSLRDTEPKK